MGLFGPPKIKITPHDFVKAELDRIFSPQFADAETNEFARHSRDTSILRAVSSDSYLRERRNVIVNLFQIAWDRTIPHPIFIEYASIIHDDPRVKAIDTGVYDRALSRAQEAGMDTFGYISSVFLAQILPDGVDTHQPDFKTLYVIFGTDFTSRYISYEALIKRHKLVPSQ
jgi:hypothetical protein